VTLLINTCLELLEGANHIVTLILTVSFFALKTWTSMRKKMWMKELRWGFKRPLFWTQMVIEETSFNPKLPLLFEIFLQPHEPQSMSKIKNQIIQISVSFWSFSSPCLEINHQTNFLPFSGDSTSRQLASPISKFCDLEIQEVYNFYSKILCSLAHHLFMSTYYVHHFC
jgi:hypothetical protein